MSKMSALFLEIEELLERDYTASEIADRLNIDIDLVYDVMDTIFGTDEDYGGYDAE